MPRGLWGFGRGGSGGVDGIEFCSLMLVAVGTRIALDAAPIAAANGHERGAECGVRRFMGEPHRHRSRTRQQERPGPSTR